MTLFSIQHNTVPIVIEERTHLSFVWAEVGADRIAVLGQIRRDGSQEGIESAKGEWVEGQ